MIEEGLIVGTDVVGVTKTKDKNSPTAKREMWQRQGRNMLKDKKNCKIAKQSKLIHIYRSIQIVQSKLIRESKINLSSIGSKDIIVNVGM